MKPDVLGIDIGMVLIGERDMSVRSDDPCFPAAYLAREEVEGAIDAVSRLARERFDGRVCVVSKRSLATRDLAIRWLIRHSFWSRTGLGIDGLHFCLTRAGKAPICEQLGVTHFVDNRLEVLSHLESVPNRYLINAEDDEVDRFADHLSLVTRVASWKDILDLLL